MPVLLRRNEHIITKALSGRGARIAECFVWIQREGGVVTDFATVMGIICDVAQRARSDLDCLESRGNLHVFSQYGYMIPNRQ